MVRRDCRLLSKLAFKKKKKELRVSAASSPGDAGDGASVSLHWPHFFPDADVFHVCFPVRV